MQDLIQIFNYNPVWKPEDQSPIGIANIALISAYFNVKDTKFLQILGESMRMKLKDMDE